MPSKIIPAKPAKARQSPPPEGAKDELLMVIGSGPSLAYVEQLIAQAGANGVLVHNAIEQQELDDLLGMIETAKAVHVLLDPKKR